MAINFLENYLGTWTITAPGCPNGFNLHQDCYGKKQLYEIRIGEFPGQLSNYRDEFIDAQVTEHCYYDHSTQTIVRDIKDRIINLLFRENKIIFIKSF